MPGTIQLAGIEALVQRQFSNVVGVSFLSFFHNHRLNKSKNKFEALNESGSMGFSAQQLPGHPEPMGFKLRHNFQFDGNSVWKSCSGKRTTR